MADLYTLLRDTLRRSDFEDPAGRERIYVQARMAMVRRLWAFQPPLSTAEIDGNIELFDEAVGQLEQDIAEGRVSATPPEAEDAWDPPDASAPEPDMALAGAGSGAADDLDDLPPRQSLVVAAPPPPAPPGGGLDPDAMAEDDDWDDGRWDETAAADETDPPPRLDGPDAWDETQEAWNAGPDAPAEAEATADGDDDGDAAEPDEGRPPAAGTAAAAVGRRIAWRPPAGPKLKTDKATRLSAGLRAAFARIRPAGMPRAKAPGPAVPARQSGDETALPERALAAEGIAAPEPDGAVDPADNAPNAVAVAPIAALPAPPRPSRPQPTQAPRAPAPPPRTPRLPRAARRQDLVVTRVPETIGAEAVFTGGAAERYGASDDDDRQPDSDRARQNDAQEGLSPGTQGAPAAPRRQLPQWSWPAGLRLAPGRLLTLGLVILAVGVLAWCAVLLMPLFTGGSQQASTPDAPPPAVSEAAAPPAAGSPPAEARPVSPDARQSIGLFDGRNPTVFVSGSDNPIRFAGDALGNYARISSSAGSPGARAVIGPGLAEHLGGRRVRIVVQARASEEVGAATMRFAYITANGVSPWKTALLSGSYASIELVWTVPENTPGTSHAILIEPGIPGEGTGTDIRSIAIEVLGPKA